MKTHKHQAMTLIEILIAIGVFAVGVLAILQLVTNNIRTTDQVSKHTDATMLATQWLELLYEMRNTNSYKEVERDCYQIAKNINKETACKKNARLSTLWENQALKISLVWPQEKTYHKIETQTINEDPKENLKNFRLYRHIDPKTQLTYFNHDNSGKETPYARYITIHPLFHPRPMKRKGFTLLELLIVITVFAILATVLFRTYNTIVQLSVRSQFQKDIQTDVLFVNQTMHSLADNYTVDYERYKDNDIDKNGMVQKLYLIDQKDKQKMLEEKRKTEEARQKNRRSAKRDYETYTKTNKPKTVTLSYSKNCYTGNPDEKEKLIQALQNNYDCGIYYQKNDDEAKRLTSPQTLVTNVWRQLIPYQSNQTTLKTAKNPQTVYQTIAYPAVTMYRRAYHQGYGIRGVTNVSQAVQWFFTLTDKPQL